MLSAQKKAGESAEDGERYAPHSTPQFERAHSHIQPLLLTLKKKIPKPRVLDVGCGVGDVAAWLATQECQVDAFDVSAGMISEAKKKHADSQVNFSVQNAASFRLLPKKFDWIISTSTLQWLSDEEIKGCFQAVSRHLNEGGQLFILLPTHDFPHRIIKGVAAQKKWKEHFTDFHEPQYLMRTQDQYNNFLQQAGFHNIELRHEFSQHRLSIDNFVGFTKQWCGCYRTPKDAVLRAAFENDVKQALRQKACIDEGGNDVVFRQKSLLITAKKSPALALKQNMLTQKRNGPDDSREDQQSSKHRATV